MRSILSRPFATREARRFSRPLWVLMVSLHFVVGAVAVAAEASSPRRVIALDGNWQVEQGGMESPPEVFSHTVVVPGLLDMAQPVFAEVGRKSALREAFWYRRTFHLDGPLPAVAMLKVSKAMFGTRVILNGTLLGERFRPGDNFPFASFAAEAFEMDVAAKVKTLRDTE